MIRIDQRQDRMMVVVAPGAQGGGYTIQEKLNRLREDFRNRQIVVSQLLSHGLVAD